MTVEVAVADDRVPRGVAAPLRFLIRATLALENARVTEIGVVLAGDAALRELNRRWRGIDRATDVISFPYFLGTRGRTRLVAGDLAISMDRAFEQAHRYRVGRGRELARLVIHGTLHLVGHDHHRLAERRIMRRAEARAMRAARDTIAVLDDLWRKR
jgi:probable rRNA maturation factor